MVAAARLIHPAPAATVVLLSCALAAILIAQAGIRPDGLVLTIISVAGSQVFIGATNDLWDEERDREAGRNEKPLPSGAISRRMAGAVAAAGLVIELAALVALGTLPLVIGLAATASATAYNTLLSRTPFSPLPYLVSFGLLPLWIAVGIGVDLGRVLPAVPLASLLAGAAHLANALRDFDADAAGGSRTLAQLLGRRGTRLIAAACLVGVGTGVGLALAIGGAGTMSVALGAVGVGMVVVGSLRERWLWYGTLLAAIAWTAAWALATG